MISFFDVEQTKNENMKKIGKSISLRSTSTYGLKQYLDPKKIVVSGYFVKSPPNDKIRNQVSRWQQRWFVLYNVTNSFEIYYYKKAAQQEDGEKPLGKIQLHNASVTSHVGGLRFSFVINLHTDERLWHLCTDDKETYSTWFKYLKYCCPASPAFVEPKNSSLTYGCTDVSEIKNTLYSDENSTQLDEKSRSPNETPNIVKDKRSPNENTFPLLQNLMTPFIPSPTCINPPTTYLDPPPTHLDPPPSYFDDKDDMHNHSSTIGFQFDNINNESIESSIIDTESAHSNQDVEYDKSKLSLPLVQKSSSFLSNFIQDDIFGNNTFQGPTLKRKMVNNFSRSCGNLIDAVENNNIDKYSSVLEL